MILVIAEQRDGRLNRVSWETIAAAQRLAGDVPIAVVVPGAGARTSAPGTTTAQRLAGDVPIAVVVPGADVRAPAQELASADVHEVLVVEHPTLASYTPDAFTTALQAVVENTSPAFVLFPHTYQTRDFAPMLASRLRRPLITDVADIGGSSSDATFSRPMFQGKLVATVRPTGDSPFFVTIQVGAFRADAAKRGGSAPIRSIAVDVDSAGIRQTAEAPFQQARQAVDLSQAERIVSVGRGIKSQENLPIVQKLAAALGAEIAASRPICDNGWLPMERQIGSSGQTVAPKLYMAVGISGAIQHLVGMKGARTIVAINKDADAPIFEVADYGIVGDLFEIVPAITAELEKG